MPRYRMTVRFNASKTASNHMEKSSDPIKNGSLQEMMEWI